MELLTDKICCLLRTGRLEQTEPFACLRSPESVLFFLFFRLIFQFFQLPELMLLFVSRPKDLVLRVVRLLVPFRNLVVKMVQLFLQRHDFGVALVKILHELRLAELGRQLVLIQLADLRPQLAHQLVLQIFLECFELSLVARRQAFVVLFHDF